MSNVLSKFFKTARKSKAKVDDRIKAFHSTDTEFDKFKNPQLGYHFGANAELSKRAAEKGGKFDTKETEYELNLKNPLVIEDAKLTPSGWTYHHLIDLLDEQKVINDDEFNKLYDYAEDLEAKVNRYEMSDEEFANEIKVMFRDILAEKGYDGIKWWNDFDNSPTHEQLAKATWDATLNDGKGGYIVPGATLDPDWSYIAFSNRQIEKRKTPPGKANDLWSVKQIDIDELMPLREGGEGVKGDRSITNRPLSLLSGDTTDSPTRVQELKKQIQEEGLNKPLTVSYDPSNGRIRLEEGNHRLAALKELGYDKVPVEIQRKDFSADFFSNMQTTKTNLQPTLKQRSKTLLGKEVTDTAIDPTEVFKNINKRPEYGSKSFINDPQRAYTLDEAFKLEPPNRNKLSDAAHVFRGEEGFNASPYTKQNITDEAYNEGLIKLATPNSIDPSLPIKTRIQLEKEREGLQKQLVENMHSQGLIDRMEGSKYTLERPLYVTRNVGYRTNAPKPIDVESNNLYSTKMIDPNHPDFLNALNRQASQYGVFGSNPYIIRLDKGTEVYHPSGQADFGEMVIKGSDIQDSQKFKLDEFLQMNPEDIKKGTDWFSSLGLMNNIA